MKKIIETLVRKLRLDLQGLVVVTEAASGDYSYLPLMAAVAGARKVYALGRDSSYGTYKENKEIIESRAVDWDLDYIIDVVPVDQFENWHEADIVTNSGMLRPIDEQKISQLKPTAVIPLMWETWEFRPNEIDIRACQQFEIPVIGTEEQYKDIDMYHYPGMLALKLLFEVKSDFSSDRIALIGGGLTGSLIARTLGQFNHELLWYADQPLSRITNQGVHSYSDLDRLLQIEDLEVLFIAEHAVHDLLLGKDGYVSFQDLAGKFPGIKVVHLCGHIDVHDLETSGLTYYPTKVAPFGHMSVLPTVMSPKPTIKLFCGGLKVGQIASNIRLSGGTVLESIQATLDHGIGQDFPGGFLNYG